MHRYHSWDLLPVSLFLSPGLPVVYLFSLHLLRLILFVTVSACMLLAWPEVVSGSLSLSIRSTADLQALSDIRRSNGWRRSWMLYWHPLLCPLVSVYAQWAPSDLSYVAPRPLLSAIWLAYTSAWAALSVCLSVLASHSTRKPMRNVYSANFDETIGRSTFP